MFSLTTLKCRFSSTKISQVHIKNTRVRLLHFSFWLEKYNNLKTNKFGKPLNVPGSEKFTIVLNQVVFILTHVCPII